MLFLELILTIINTVTASTTHHAVLLTLHIDIASTTRNRTLRHMIFLNWRSRPDLNRDLKDLQSHALPFCYGSNWLLIMDSNHNTLSQSQVSYR